MVTAIRSLNNVTGAAYWLTGFFVCALIYVAVCLLFKRCRTPKGIKTIIFSLLISEIVCDIAWHLIYYPAGIYHNYGIGGMYVLLLWPIFLIFAGIITIKTIQIQQGESNMFLFNKREVCTGNSIAEPARVRDILAAHNIPYQIKVISHLGQSTGRGTIRSNSGSVGVNLDLDQQTVIYVKMQDYEEASHFIDRELR